jgi:solute carrier family 25 uncoupling protein 8/9
VIFAGLRIGLYGPIRNYYQSLLGEEGLPSLKVKVMSGITTGALGITVANPADMVKVKLQAQRSGGDKKYTGVLDCYKKVYAEAGIGGWWTGYAPNVFRNSIINAAELASYD